MSLHNSDFQHVRDDSLPPSHLHDTDEANSSSLTLPLDGNRACLSASPASCAPPAAANTTFHVTDKTSHHTPTKSTYRKAMVIKLTVSQTHPLPLFHFGRLFYYGIYGQGSTGSKPLTNVTWICATLHPFSCKNYISALTQLMIFTRTACQ